MNMASLLLKKNEAVPYSTKAAFRRSFFVHRPVHRFSLPLDRYHWQTLTRKPVKVFFRKNQKVYD
jgi:hypothetical protein